MGHHGLYLTTDCNIWFRAGVLGLDVLETPGKENMSFKEYPVQKMSAIVDAYGLDGQRTEKDMGRETRL